MIGNWVFDRRRIMLLCLAVLCAITGMPPGGNARDAATVSSDPGQTAYRWSPVAIGAGGFITGYRSDRLGLTRVIRTDTYGAYVWQPDKDAPGLGRWAQLVTSAGMPAADQTPRALNDGVYEIAVAPGDANRIYMAMKGRMFRSDNGGATFRDVSDSTHFPLVFNPNGDYRFYGPFMAVSPDDPDHVLLGTPEAGLLRSVDGGATWETVASVPKAADQDVEVDGVQAPGHVIVFGKDTREQDVVYVMAPGRGLFVSRDGGAAFTPAPDAQTGPKLVKQGVFDTNGRFFLVDQSEKAIWRYDGQGWSNLTKSRGLRAQNFASIAIDATDNTVYAFSMFGATFVSADHGDSWDRRLLPFRVAVGEGDPPWLKIANKGFVISQVVPDPTVRHRFWASTGTGVHYADMTTGWLPLTWTSMSRGIEQLVSNDVYQAPGRAPLFAVWDFGIHRKEDLDAFSTGFGPIERMIISAQQVVGTPADPDFAVTNASDHRQCCEEDGNTIMAGYSEDAGSTWSRFATLPTPPGTEPDDPWRMSFGMIAVSSSDKNNIIWVPSGNRAPFFTKDKGKTWTRIRFPGERGDLTGSHASYHLPRRVLVADPVAAATFYLVHSGNDDNKALEGLWVTRDGGGTWVKVFEGEIAPASRYSAKLRAVPHRRGDLFFSSSADGSFDTTLKRSIDGGVTWRRLDGIDRVDDIAFGKPFDNGGPPTIFLSGYVNGTYGMWRSIDDAESWTRIAHLPLGTLDQVSVMGGDPDTFGRVYVGYKGSGWLYGAQADCAPKPYGFGDEHECFQTGK